jgi:hypothetical protein
VNHSSIEDIRKQRDRIAAYSFQDRVNLLALATRPCRRDHSPLRIFSLRTMGEAGVKEVFVPKVGLADGIVYDLYQQAVRPSARLKPWHAAPPTRFPASAPAG